MKLIALSTLREAGEKYFKLKAESDTVYLVNHYDRASKKYSISKVDDISSERFIAGNKMVFVGFDY